MGRINWLSHKKTDHFSNYKMLSPDGELMCYCNEKKKDWYLNHENGLAKQIDEFTFQLTFHPHGMGHRYSPLSYFYLKKRDNRCVCCGTMEKLSSHHTVPLCYRRHFPSYLKENASHDIVLLCINCHETYELYANKLKRELISKYIKNGHKTPDKYIKMAKCKKIARALLNFRENIPSNREYELLLELETITKKMITEDDLVKFAETKIPEYQKYLSKIVVKNTEDLLEFEVMWRKHFLETMSPKYLDENWRVDAGKFLAEAHERKKDGIV